LQTEKCEIANGDRQLFIGRKVREIRQTNAATQAQFADMIGISTSYLKPDRNNQRRFASVFWRSLKNSGSISPSFPPARTTACFRR